MCGEHGGVNNYNNPTLGSSPHVRGAHVRTLIVPACGGIIPACTGSTTTSSRTRTGRWDHPRMCGEHFDEWIDDMSATGSSPHVRGAPCCLVRTTPSWGSSPHVRGAPVVHGLLDGLGGIIPACAGSTLKVSGRLRFAWDYPRMCGEHIVANRNCGSVQGSSPHVRGARAGRARPAGPSGIIPACAGSTLTPATSRCTSGDHPRMCGEHPASKDWNRKRVGSSPHVRGALW